MSETQVVVDTATSLAAIGRHAEALQVLDTGGVDVTRSAAGLLLRARIAGQTGRYDEALALLREVEQAAPVGPEASEAARLRTTLEDMRGRGALTRALVKWMAVAVPVLALVLAATGYAIGLQSGAARAQANFAGELARAHSSVQADLGRQQAALGAAVGELRAVREHLSRTDDRTNERDRLFERRLQRIESVLRGVERRLVARDAEAAKPQ